MQENLLSATPRFKLYKMRAMYIGGFIGGPLVVGYLAAQNFKQLGQPENAKRAWIIAIITSIVVFGGLSLVPDPEIIPIAIILIIYLGIGDTLVQKYQGDDIKSHIKNGGKMYSSWRAVWIGIIGLSGLVAIGYLISLLTNTPFWT
jgi:hypothetical protein